MGVAATSINMTLVVMLMLMVMARLILLNQVMG
jgi:hypothetical protein